MANAQPQASGGSSSNGNYGKYQTEIYVKGMLHGQLPSITTDSRQLEEQAKKHLGTRSYNYVAGGAGERATMDANRLAFRQWKMVPRMLRSTTPRDTSVTLFGERYDSPLLMAPIGVQSIFHPDKETGMAQVAAELGIPYIISTAASSTMEEVAEVVDSKTPSGGPRWYQLYWPHDDEVTISLLQRAKAAGYTALVVTLDTWQLAWRPSDLDNAYVPFVTGTGNQNGFSDPVFRRKFSEAHGGKQIEEDVLAASVMWERTTFSGQAHTWDQLSLLREHWDGPIVLKGIQHVDDARKAVDTGLIDGIIVSNHGGRQLDGAIGSLSVLPEIVEAVGDKTTVLFDSGIRTGVDVIKALCLGAKAVLVGRPWVYGLGIGGKAGARDVMRGILADMDQSMGLAGITSVKACTKDMVRFVQYPGDTNASN